MKLPLLSAERRGVPFIQIWGTCHVILILECVDIVKM
jgi:hypothetical protein